MLLIALSLALLVIAARLGVLEFIRGATATATMLINSLDWTDIFQSARVRSTLPQIDVTTFATEQTGNFVAGIERLTLDFSGIMAKGETPSGPLMPLSSYQNVPVSVEFDTDCEISGTFNATDSDASRLAGGVGFVTGQMISIGAFSIDWDEGT